MYSETINKQTKRVLNKIATTPFCNQFYLAGGTALAIELGHRKSIDLDWFSKNSFLNSEVKEMLSKLGVFVLNSEAEGTIHGVLDKVKVSFLRYKYSLLFPLINF